MFPDCWNEYGFIGSALKLNKDDSGMWIAERNNTQVFCLSVNKSIPYLAAIQEWTRNTLNLLRTPSPMVEYIL